MARKGGMDDGLHPGSEGAWLPKGGEEAWPAPPDELALRRVRLLDSAFAPYLLSAPDLIKAGWALGAGPPLPLDKLG
jgi:hypothetical protein